MPSRLLEYLFNYHFSQLSFDYQSTLLQHQTVPSQQTNAPINYQPLEVLSRISFFPESDEQSISPLKLQNRNPITILHNCSWYYPSLKFQSDSQQTSPFSDIVDLIELIITYHITNKVTELDITTSTFLGLFTIDLIDRKVKSICWDKFEQLLDSLINLFSKLSLSGIANYLSDSTFSPT
jgi:hypothetical protein